MPVGTEKKLKQHGDTRPAAGLLSPRGPLTLIQRKCRCGESAGLTNKCPDCRTRQLLGKSDRLDARWALSQPGDALEREAERMAQQALQKPEPAARLGYRPGVSGLTPIQRFGQASAATDVPPVVSDVVGSAGEPLDGAVCRAFEARFGHDFSQVRVHTDGPAAESADAVQAHAYTVAPHIVFAAGQYAPGAGFGQNLLAHELAHVIQQQDGAIGPQAVMRYRNSNSANFGECNGGGLTEQEFRFRKDKDTLPWIEEISVNFTGTTTDADSDVVPTGELQATYFANSSALRPIAATIVGGKASEGLTDKGNHKVRRIEGCGYHHTSVPASERLEGHKSGFKYFKPAGRSQATMNYAIFFLQGKRTGNQAIHQGSLDLGSLACVHVGNEDTIRQINYHSVQGHTKVSVSYSSSALETVCCARFDASRRMVSNPCGGQDSSTC